MGPQISKGNLTLRAGATIGIPRDWTKYKYSIKRRSVCRKDSGGANRVYRANSSDCFCAASKPVTTVNVEVGGLPAYMYISCFATVTAEQPSQSRSCCRGIFRPINCCWLFSAMRYCIGIYVWNRPNISVNRPIVFADLFDGTFTLPWYSQPRSSQCSVRGPRRACHQSGSISRENKGPSQGPWPAILQSNHCEHRESTASWPGSETSHVWASGKSLRVALNRSVVPNVMFSLALPVQVAALMEYPPLMDSAKDIFPPDVIARARQLYGEIGSIGAYSHSQGVPFIRKNVAKFIEGVCTVPGLRRSI